MHMYHIHIQRDWEEPSNLRARISDGVIALTQADPGNGDGTHASMHTYTCMYVCM